jgi:alkaline phosphatase D
VGTSITSGLGEWYTEAYEGRLQENPHVRYFDKRNGGYVRCEITPEEWCTEMKLADSIEVPTRSSPPNPLCVPTVASFVVEDGKPGAERA